MKYELSKEEIQHIEKYRNLTVGFQAVLDAQMDTFLRLQTEIPEEMLEQKQKPPPVLPTSDTEIPFL